EFETRTLPTLEEKTHPESIPPSSPALTFKVSRRRKKSPGLAALGTSVLSVQGKLGSLEERPIDLRLDSGADVSLISKDFLLSLKNKVPISKGMKMCLWQLTDKNASLEGYITLPVFIESEDGTIIETEVEAYVVPGISVDILLGEDYQMAHEVTVARDLEKGTQVSYRSCPYSIRATPIGQERKMIRAQADLKIAPNSVASLRVEEYFDNEREWLVEKSLLANSDDSFFAIPNMLFSASFPVVPVMNPTDKPRFIRKGEAVGIITDPATYLDTPKSDEHREKMEAHMTSLASMVQAMME
ncbi:hypothetical protein FIBSPDRAFT_673684, partial [Athelia psychrophila]